MLDQEHISREIRAELARRRITYAAVGALLGVHKMTISRRLRGERAWRLADVRRLAECLGVPAEQFTGPIPPPTPTEANDHEPPSTIPGAA